MQKIKRFAAILLVVALIMPNQAMAVSAAEESLSISEKIYTSDVEITNEELFALYAQQLFYGSRVSMFGTAAGETLTGDEKILYDALVPLIRQIANGDRASTAISVGQTVENLGGATYTADVEAEFTGTGFDSESLGKVIDALLADLPYEMY